MANSAPVHSRKFSKIFFVEEVPKHDFYAIWSSLADPNSIVTQITYLAQMGTSPFRSSKTRHTRTRLFQLREFPYPPEFDFFRTRHITNANMRKMLVKVRKYRFAAGKIRFKGQIKRT